MKILETERLILREFVESDADFVLDLLNQPSFIRYIGDRNVKTLEKAREVIENRYRASYRSDGFGFYAVELKPDAKTDAETEIEHPTSETENPLIGMCGFVKREELADVDVGFAFLPQHERKGYAYESAAAVMKYGRETLNLKRVVAITSVDNASSIKLLEKLGFKFEKLIDFHGETINLFANEEELQQR